MNEARVQVYERLLEAEEQIAQARYRAGISPDAVEAALDAAEARLAEHERQEDIYVSSLGYFVEALGGHLEVRAVFPGCNPVIVRREP